MNASVRARARERERERKRERKRSRQLMDNGDPPAKRAGTTTGGGVSRPADSLGTTALAVAGGGHGL